MGIVTDNFDRADGGLGASWAALVGTWTVASNQAECNDDDGGTGYYARFDGTGADVGSTDMYTEADANPSQTNGNSNTGVAVRMRSAANTSYQFTTNEPNNSCAFWRIVAGSETQITGANNSLTFTTPIAVGDRIRLEVTASTLRARVNGALVGLARDTNISDGQRGGLNGYNNVGTDVVRVDNFEAGALSDDPPLAPYLHTWVVFGAGTITPRTPALPSTTGHIAAGDLILAWATVRDAAQTVTPDAAEGWSTIQTPSQTGLESPLLAKVWGLGGQTDDLTPEFSVSDASAGFGITLVVIRNPQHATNPWTSVASAIVASGEQSNAANNTVTAPSVSHSGSHRTVVRFFSSADDNSLGTPSEGLLVFGGTGWHTTAGNDFAQACSVLEDTTLASSTGTATVTEAAAGPDVSNGVTIVVAIPSGGGTTVGVLSETDALLAVARTSDTTSGLLTEADALSVGARSVSSALGTLGETDSLSSAAASHDQPSGVVAEADTLSAAQRSVVTALGALSEANSLETASAGHSITVSPLGELDSLLAVVPAQQVGALAEIDQMQSVGHQTSRTVGLLDEIDGVTALDRSTERPVGTMAEIDGLAPATRQVSQLAGLLTELDTLLAPIIERSNAQLSASELMPRCAAALLLARRRTIGSLGQRLAAGGLEAEP